ncbi:MAG: flagellar biosynthetic protein FliO [Rhodospirillaceae bacterium]|nr:flagellar biosynthetic protein FliO [Rhodospirillaceae bacterium]
MEPTDYIRFLLALVIVLGLILALSWALKRFGLGQGQANAMGRKRRLRTIESATLDARHRIVLVRRDAVEHLVLLGPNSTQVIERGIPAPADDVNAPGMAETFKTLLSSQTPAKDPAP